MPGPRTLPWPRLDNLQRSYRIAAHNSHAHLPRFPARQAFHAVIYYHVHELIIAAQRPLDRAVGIQRHCVWTSKSTKDGQGVCAPRRGAGSSAKPHTLKKSEHATMAASQNRRRRGGPHLRDSLFSMSFFISGRYLAMLHATPGGVARTPGAAAMLRAKLQRREDKERPQHSTRLAVFACLSG